MKFLDELSEKLCNALPDSVRTLKEDARKNFKIVLQDALTKMKLVTREEFDVQKAALARAQEKLHALEEMLKAYKRD